MRGLVHQVGPAPSGDALSIDVVRAKTFSSEDGVDLVGELDVSSGSYIIEDDWTASTLPSSANWWSVTYGNGKYVAVATSSSTAAYSTDGINWTASTLPSSASWYSVTYGNGKYVAVVNGSNTAAYSTAVLELETL